MNKLFIGWAIILAGLILLAGCGPADSTDTSIEADTVIATQGASASTEPVSTEPQYGGTLRVVTVTSPTNIGYPPEGRQQAKFFYYPGIEPLMQPAEDAWETQQIDPILAKSWEPENDMKSWILHLRKGVKFHDGTPFNAEAVKFNFELMKEHGSRPTLIDMKSAEILDEFTIRVNFDYPCNTFIADVMDVSYIISPTSFINSGKTYEERVQWANEHPVGTGPYKLVSYKRGSAVTWTRFDDYWGGKPYLDGLEIKIVPDPMIAGSMMRAGEADLYVHADVRSVEELTKYKGFVGRYNDHIAVIGIFPSAKDPESVYADKRVREALEYAIDREAIAASLSTGNVKYKARYQLPFPGDSAYRPEWGRIYDPEKAKSLLKEAGLEKGFQTKCFITSGNVLQKNIAIAAQAYLSAVDIKMSIEVTHGGRTREMMVNGWGKGNLLINTYSLSPIPISSVIDWFQPGHRRMQGDTVLTPEMGDLVLTLEDSTNEEEMERLYIKLMHLVGDESFGVLVTNEIYAAGYADNVHTQWLIPNDRGWRVEHDWLEKK